MAALEFQWKNSAKKRRLRSLRHIILEDEQNSQILSNAEVSKGGKQHPMFVEGVLFQGRFCEVLPRRQVRRQRVPIGNQFHFHAVAAFTQVIINALPVRSALNSQ